MRSRHGLRAAEAGLRRTTCAGEDLNLHGALTPQGPQPCASTNSATSARRHCSPPSLAAQYAPCASCATRGRAAALGGGSVVRRRARRRTPAQVVGTKNGRVETLDDAESEGIGVRVLVDGAWGFACDRRLDAGRARGGARAPAPSPGGAGRGTGARSRRSSRQSGVLRDAASSATRSRSRSPTRSSSASRAEGALAHAGRQGRPRPRSAPSASTRCSSPPRAPTSSRSSSSAAAASTRSRSGDGVAQMRSYPSAHGGSSAQAGWEYVESLGLEREAPRVARAGGRAAARRAVPGRRDRRS